MNIICNKYLSAFFVLLVCLLTMNSCGKADDATGNGDPLLTDNDKITAIQEPDILPPPTVDIQKELKQLMETKKPVGESPKKTPKPQSGSGIVSSPSSSPTSASTTAEPPPTTIDYSAIQRLLANFNPDPLVKRAQTAAAKAEQAESRAKSGSQTAQTAAKTAKDKGCPEANDVENEAEKAQSAAKTATANAQNAQEAAASVGSAAQALRNALAEVNNDFRALQAGNGNMQTLIAKAAPLQAPYDQLRRDLSTAESSATSANNSASIAETSAQNATRISSICKKIQAPEPPKPTPTSTPKPQPKPSVLPKEEPVISTKAPSNVNKRNIQSDLQENMMDLSNKPRDQKLMANIKSYFQSVSQKGVIVSETGTYSVDQYIAKLNLSGSHDIQITNLNLNDEGQVIRVELEETKLEK